MTKIELHLYVARDTKNTFVYEDPQGFPSSDPRWAVVQLQRALRRKLGNATRIKVTIEPDDEDGE